MHDVLVLGAGPAGSTVARRLAAAGVRVALVGAATRAGLEGLSVRTRALLEEEDLPGGVERLAAREERRHASLQHAPIIAGPFQRGGEWAGRAVAGVEWLTERSRLAAALRCAAQSAGAELRCDTALNPLRRDGVWRAPLRSGASVAAPMLVDARGRRGAERRGPLLLAFGRRFRRRRAGADGSQIHALDDGWCWWAMQGSSLWVQVVSQPRARHPSAWIGAAALALPALANALASAEPLGESVARPAHARRALAAPDCTCWRVGDSAAALDPLSGQGVYEALRGARLVATAVQSVLNGGDALLAQRFVTERQEEAWVSGLRSAAGFYGENAARSSFWARTAAAYGALLQPKHTAQGVERRPVLLDGCIVEQEVIVTPEHPRGVWHVEGVPLVALKGYLDSTDCATVAAAAAALARPQAAVAAAIHWLHKTGMVPRQAASSLVGRLDS